MIYRIWSYMYMQIYRYIHNMYMYMMLCKKKDSQKNLFDCYTHKEKHKKQMLVIRVSKSKIKHYPNQAYQERHYTTNKKLNESKKS